MQIHNIFLDRFPKIDLHGHTRDTARVLVNDFIDESIAMGHKEIIIIHGIGTGALKTEVKETLSRNKKVSSYYVEPSNIGCTVVKLKD